jgi:hypothetical protein
MEQPPKSTPPELAEYLTRQLEELTPSGSIKLSVFNVLPTKPVIGRLYYFNVIPSTSITTEGVWVYKSTGWSFLG